VWASSVADPVAVRYAWADNPRCNMFSSAGLPLTPFRTDDFPGLTVNAK
jgi:sialate O-acetylesterase